MAVTAVSLVVAAVPESLPAVVTLALALGARRMAAARAIPRRLHAVETLGSVTVIASDKTGTLTEGRMAVQSAVTGDGAVFGVTGSGYAPHGTVHRDGAPVAVPDELRRLARAGLLCNDATLAPPTEQRPRWGAVGDPLEAALVAFAARCGLDPQTTRNAWPRVAEHPFDQQLRRMTTVHRSCDRRYLVVCKGAPENVLTAPLLDADADELAALTAAAHRLAGARWSGRRRRSAARRAPDIADGFADAGVRLVLVTGDHPATAAAIAGQLGLWSEGDPVVRGDDGDPAAAPPATRVYARTQPEQKLDIIAGLQSRGHVVAMTGDGVNDAPALRRADIGVAMGGGTEVARQAADLVLVDDDLSTVTAAIGEGRRIYDNIRRFLRYALSGGVAEIAVMLLGPLFGLPVPLLPAQILWINLLTHGVPGVALGAEPAEPGSLRRVPRSPQESVLGAGLAGRSWSLPLAVTASALLQVAGVLLPPLRELLGTEVLGVTELLACAAVSVLPGLALRLTRRTSGTDLSTLTPSVREADSGVEKEMR